MTSFIDELVLGGLLILGKLIKPCLLADEEGFQKPDANPLSIVQNQSTEWFHQPANYHDAETKSPKPPDLSGIMG